MPFSYNFRGLFRSYDSFLHLDENLHSLNIHLRIIVRIQVESGRSVSNISYKAKAHKLVIKPNKFNVIQLVHANLNKTVFLFVSRLHNSAVVSAGVTHSILIMGMVFNIHSYDNICVGLQYVHAESDKLAIAVQSRVPVATGLFLHI